MKKIYAFIIIMLFALTIQSNAQVNYIFSASSTPYVPVTGGTTPHLLTDYSEWAPEDEGFATIPIGFTFKYNDDNYTQANVDVNGFITLGGSLDVFYNYPYFTNRLANAPDYNKRPVIAAFWDDLLLLDTSDLVYKTTGHAPFRVFTVEWKKAKWVYESLAPVLSIELKLYETTNIIEFHYKDEGSLPDPQYAFASIGITSAWANRDFISLQSTSAHPDISMLRANDSLSVKPADNQVYRFIPSPVKIPAPLEQSLSYTNNKVSFKLQSGGFNSYEYAITHSPIPPSSGTKTFSPNVTISSLSAETTYYIYARSNLFGFFNSQWACDSFTTAANPVALPYNEDFEDIVYPLTIPKNMRTQDFRDTNFFYDPVNFQGPVAFPQFDGEGNSLFYFQIDTYDANLWLFTPGIKLIAGKTYKLNFSYASFWEYDPGDPASLEVNYGTATGGSAMTSGLLFKKNDITNTDALMDTAIEFSPPGSGIYYFGFHNLSLFMKGALFLDNISLSEKTASPETPIVLEGKTNNIDNVLNWAVMDNKISADFELQRSTDGTNFTRIDNVTANNMMGSKTHSTFRIQRNTGMINSKDKHSKEFNKLRPEIELQRRGDGINFTTAISSTINNSNKSGVKVNYNYTDRNTKGLNYYRLQKIEKNGTISYSNTVTLNGNTLPSALKVYPNPAKDLLNVKIPFGTDEKMTLVVTDVLGRIVLTKVIEGIKGENIQLDISHFNAGTYFVKLIHTDSNENAVIKFEKN